MHASHAIAQFMDVYGLATYSSDIIGPYIYIYIQVHLQLGKKDSLIIT